MVDSTNCWWFLAWKGILSGWKRRKRARRIIFRWIYVNGIKELRWQYNDGESRDHKNLEL